MTDTQQVTPSYLTAQEIEEFVELCADYLGDRKHVYCACFEGGTFCCIDCQTSERSRWWGNEA